MDVGIFKASRARLTAWIVIPPLLIATVGLGSLAMKQHAEWNLKQTQSLADVLPSVVEAQLEIQKLFEGLGLSTEKRIASEDQLISLLQQKALERNILFKTVQVTRLDKSKGSAVPVLSAVVEAYGDFSAFQFYLNDIKAAQPLLSATSIKMDQRAGGGNDGDFEFRAVFDLLLLDQILKARGGLQ